VTHALARVGGAMVGVPDPESTAAFLHDALQFEAREQVDGWAIVCDGDYGPDPQTAIELRKAGELTLLELVLEIADEEHIAPIADRAARAGASIVAGDGAGACFVDPSGVTMRCVSAASRRTEMPVPNELRPRRLGHVNLKAPEPPATAAFWQEGLGLRLSEQIGDRLFFLRIGSEHHNVGLRPGATGGLHHLGFEIGGWQHYQPILDRLAALGHRVEYGPGRHTPGNNIFTYLVEPSSGLRIELFADMAQIPDAATYEPPRWEIEDRFSQTLNRWGPLPPESFLA
jgi:catechol 2,3-dioxygenase-like lactoylglutathione lyase family enzyme